MVQELLAHPQKEDAPQVGKAVASGLYCVYLWNIIWKYGDEQVRQQIQAVYDAGYDQWILWDAGVSYHYGGLLTPEEAEEEDQRISQSRAALETEGRCREGSGRISPGRNCPARERSGRDIPARERSARDCPAGRRSLTKRHAGKRKSI